jgi:hypothetical protein
MVMPEKLQPGPLAGKISFFCPVSLFFFFFLLLIITTMRGIELHPMNYFFLAAAFFSFHLLLAYLVDHVSIHLAFVISSLVSIFLSSVTFAWWWEMRSPAARRIGPVCLPRNVFLRLLSKGLYRAGDNDWFSYHVVCGDADYRANPLGRPFFP